MKLDRLKMLVGLRKTWREQVAEVRRMRAWIIQTEHILAGQWAAPDETLSNETVGQRFDAWCRQLAQLATSEPLSNDEQDCLANFLKVTTDLRPHLIAHTFSIIYPLHLGQLFGFSTFAVHIYLHLIHLYCMFYIMKKIMRICKRTNYIRLWLYCLFLLVFAVVLQLLILHQKANMIDI